jgi:hypothetical protein
MARGSLSIALLCALCLVVAGCGRSATAGTGSSSTASSTTPVPTPAIPSATLKAAALNVLRAYNDKKAGEVCATLGPTAQRWTAWLTNALYHVPVTCEQLTAPEFKPQTTDSGTVLAPVYKRISVLRWRRVGMRDGYGRVDMLVHVGYPGTLPQDSPLKYPHEIVLYFTSDHGKLLLARPVDMSSVVLGGDPKADTSVEPTPPAATRSAIAIPPPSFPCAGATQSASDAADDVETGVEVSLKPATAPWLDIRKVVTHGISGAHPCVEIDFAEPIRPPIDIQIMDLDTVPSPDLAIAANDDFFAGGGTDWHLKRPYGERGSAVFVALDPKYTQWRFDNLRVCVQSPVLDDPLLRSLRSPYDGWQGSATPGDVNSECSG